MPDVLLSNSSQFLSWFERFRTSYFIWQEDFFTMRPSNTSSFDGRT